jgi:hypothetical protein
MHVCLIPYHPPPLHKRGVVGHAIDSCITYPAKNWQASSVQYILAHNCEYIWYSCINLESMNEIDLVHAECSSTTFSFLTITTAWQTVQTIHRASSKCYIDGGIVPQITNSPTTPKSHVSDGLRHSDFCLRNPLLGFFCSLYLRPFHAACFTASGLADLSMVNCCYAKWS